MTLGLEGNQGLVFVSCCCVKLELNVTTTSTVIVTVTVKRHFLYIAVSC